MSSKLTDETFWVRILMLLTAIGSPLLVLGGILRLTPLAIAGAVLIAPGLIASLLLAFLVVPFLVVVNCRSKIIKWLAQKRAERKGED